MDFSARQIEIIEAAGKRIDLHGIQNLTTKTLAADIGLSEPALYRHFENKNAILLGMLHYFIGQMRNRLSNIFSKNTESASEELLEIFDSQFVDFMRNPAIVSVLLSEGIFSFDDALADKVSEVMQLMQSYIGENIKRGQESGQYNTMVPASTLTVIITGSMRMTILKWKLSGRKTDLRENGSLVLKGILKMIENK